MKSVEPALQPGESAQPSSSLISVDSEGDWFYQGNPIHRPDILELFVTQVRQTPDGTYRIEWQGKSCAVEVADTPFVAVRADRLKCEGSGEECILVRIKHLPTPQVLDPSSLRVGHGNVLYGTVSGGRRIRFSRPAYYQIASWIAEGEKPGAFHLELNGVRYPVVFEEDVVMEPA